jgi:hypothetical protein
VGLEIGAEANVAPEEEAPSRIGQVRPLDLDDIGP